MAGILALAPLPLASSGSGLAWLSSAVVAGIIPAAVFGVFALLRKFIPPTPVDRQLSLAALETKYGWLVRVEAVLNLLVVLPAVGGLTVLLTWSLHRFTQWWQHRPDTVQLQAPPWAYCLFPAAVFSVCIVTLLAYVGWRLYLRGDYAEWMAYGRLKLRMNVMPLAKVLGALAVLAATATTVLNLDCYTRATADHLIINPYWTLGERTYSYPEVRRITREDCRAPSGQETRSVAIYRIEFADGYRWCNQGLALDLMADDRALVEYVGRRAGKPIEVVPPVPRR